MPRSASIHELVRAGARRRTSDVDVWRALPARRRAARRRAGPGGLWEVLLDRTDLALTRPTLAPDVEIKEFPGDGYAMVANPRDLVHLRVPLEDVSLLRAMDGTRTVQDLVVERLQDAGDLELGPVLGLVMDLHEGGFLRERFVDVGTAVKVNMDTRSRLRRKLATFAKTLTLEWNGAHAFVEWLYRHGFRSLLTPPAVAVMGVVAVAGFAAFLRVRSAGLFSFAEESLALEGLIIFVMNYVMLVLHEVGHGLVLVRYRRRVKHAAFQIYFGAPSLLVEASDVLMLEPRQRIQQAAAGPFTEAVLAGVFSLVIWAFPEMPLAPLLFKFIVLNYFYVFLNLVPLLELDGYWILADTIGVADLRPRSLSFVRRELVPKLLRRERFSRREVGLALYGIVGVAFTILAVAWSLSFWSHLFGSFVRRMWHGGAVTRLILIALALFIGGPLLRALVRLLKNLVTSARALAERTRFRLETRWRVEAAELIQSVPFVHGLEQEELNDLAGRVRLRSARAGETVVRQGEPGESFFIVRSGVLDALEEGEGGAERPLRALGRGDAFGELAMLHRASRSATVRARTDATLFEIDRGTFDRLLASRIAEPELAPTAQQAVELRQIRCLAKLEADQLAELLAYGEWVDVPAGATVIKRGEKGDAFFGIRSGRAEVLQGARQVAVLGAGDHFGELALLSRAPRAATVRALSPLRVFRVSKAGFDKIVRRVLRSSKARARVARQPSRY